MRSGTWYEARRESQEIDMHQKPATTKSGVAGSHGGLLRGEAVRADAADFGAGNSDLDVAISGDLFLQLLVEAGFEFANLPAAQAGNVNVIARAVSFIVMPIPAKVEKIKLVDQALTLEQVNGTVDGDEMDFGIDFLRPLKDLVDIEVLFRGIHDFKDDSTLASKANAPLAKSVLEMACRLSCVNAFTGRDAAGWHGCRHGARYLEESLAGGCGIWKCRTGKAYGR